MTEETLHKAQDEGARTTREPLTHNRILAAALRIMDEEGLEAVSMRRIGRELGVEAMSLYNHVRDKEDVLDGVTDLVMGGFELPEPSEDWENAVREGARAWRRMLKAHPGVITLLFERKHPMKTVEALRPMEIALEILRSPGLSTPETVQAFHVFGGYILGFVTMELSQAFELGEENHRRAHEEFARGVPPEQLPRLTESLPYFADCDFDAEFDFGLELLIAGLWARTEGRR
ncbi:MAG TPA: TetR/AcrR family transcriptional regulator [Actinomycetota bacterium]|nr:TetR/AcrR family transcriptional regulator [Actinomycetota bacterium]